jgi:hypothetical protein
MSHSSLSIGIVGLPNVGKSTLFNSLLKKTVADAQNYPFCTIEPNVGVVEVPDERLAPLATLVKTQTIIPAAVEFTDIAGLVRGASEGEGLGNKFLSHIREVAAIAHVTRLFEDDDVIHVSNTVNPVDDIKTIETELILADLATVERQQTGKKGQKPSKTDEVFASAVSKLREGLNAGTPARRIELTDDEQDHAYHLHLITAKPMMYVFNLSETQLEQQDKTTTQINQILADIGDPDATFVALSAKLENEVLGLSEEEQQEYLAQFHLEQTGLNRLIQSAYRSLDLISFLTAGEKEVRAWTVQSGTPAPLAAGVIHTDFIKHFIRADVVPYPDFIATKGWVGAREAGKVISAGKEYIVKDGDVIEFKVGV